MILKFICAAFIQIHNNWLHAYIPSLTILLLMGIEFWLVVISLVLTLLYNCICADMWGFPGGKEPACQWRRHEMRCSFHPWVGKTLWKRACNPLQYSCLVNSMDRGVHSVAKSQVQLKWLSMHVYRGINFPSKRSMREVTGT